MSSAHAVIVADAGPLIVLGLAGLLAPAAELLGPMAVPQAVLDECLARSQAAGAPQIAEALRAQHLHAIPHQALATLDSADSRGLGLGEIAVIAYARMNGLVALVDDRKARSTARRLGVQLMGSGTVLVGLKQAGKLGSIAPVLQLWSAHGYFVSSPVQAELLASAGESIP